jgi:hypothetical protein
MGAWALRARSGLRGLTLLAAALFAWAGAASAQEAEAPRPLSVLWTPGSVAASIAPGRPQTVTVQFQAERDFQNAVLFVTSPNARPFVTISPPTFASVRRGEIKEVTLTFAVPQAGTRLTRVRNRITIRAGQALLRSALPFTLTVGPGDGGGGGGDETVAGRDDDGDGVRDDIETYIDATFPEQRTRDAARQFAAAAQRALLQAGSKEQSLRNASAVMRATECMRSLEGGETREIIGELKARLLNNRARSEAFLTFNDQLGGESFPGVPASRRSSSCS